MKMTKVFVSTLLLALLAISSSPLALAAPSGDSTPTVNVYNWGMYISDGSDGFIDVNKAFEEATGIKVNYMTFDSNETMYTRLKTSGANYDVIIPSDYMIARLIEDDMLEPINFDNVPNYHYIDEEFRNQNYDPENLYSVPYTWGTVGLIYNSKYVTSDDVDSWKLMWNEDYKGKILMFDNPRDSFAIAQSVLGQSLNSEDETELRDAADLLKKQKPLVQSYAMDQIFEAMEREEAWIGAYYAGDYLLMAEENENLSFSFPKEGFNIFIDALCIPKGAENKEAAEAYINFLCDPEISGQNMDYLGYSTPISTAKEFMNPEAVQSDIAYPDAETLARASSFTALSPEATELMESLWLDVKADKNDDGGIDWLMFLGIGIIAVLLLVMLILTAQKRKRNSARNRMG